MSVLASPNTSDEDQSTEFILQRELPSLTLKDVATGQRLEIWHGEKMQTLADALARLEELRNLQEDSTVRILARPIALPDGQLTFCLLVLGADPFGPVVGMPWSARFEARGTLGERRHYDAGLLHTATSDADGNVTLQDGSHVHAIKFERTEAHSQLSPLEEQILRITVSLLNAEKACYRELDEVALPGIRFLDYINLRDLHIPSLKAHVFDVRQRLDVSGETIAPALRKAGVRPRCSSQRAA